MEKIDNVKSVFKKKEDAMKNTAVVSPAVIRRLPRYHRYLGELLRKDILRVSSGELADMMGVTASQIRQDLNCFGGFGQQGYGYNVRYLHDKIGELLGMNEGYRAVIVGAGNLGRAIVSSHMFERRGVTRLALFDVDKKLIGSSVSDVPIYDARELSAFCEENRVEIGVVTTPKEAAMSVIKSLIAAGVRGIWNFSNTEIRSPDPCVSVENIHLGDSLMKLCYDIKNNTAKHSEVTKKTGEKHEI